MPPVCREDWVGVPGTWLACPMPQWPVHVELGHVCSLWAPTPSLLSILRRVNPEGNRLINQVRESEEEDIFCFLLVFRAGNQSKLSLQCLLQTRGQRSIVNSLLTAVPVLCLLYCKCRLRRVTCPVEEPRGLEADSRLVLRTVGSTLCCVSRVPTQKNMSGKSSSCRCSVNITTCFLRGSLRLSLHSFRRQESWPKSSGWGTWVGPLLCGCAWGSSFWPSVTVGGTGSPF